MSVSEGIVLSERISELIPSLTDLVTGTLGAAVLYHLGASLAIRGKSRGLRTGDTRKMFHLLVFGGAALLRAIGPVSGVVVYGVWGVLLISVTIARGPGSPLFEAVARPEDGDYRRLNVFLSLISTGLGGIAAHLLVGRFALVSFLVAGFGDALGELVGIRWGKHPLPCSGNLLGKRSVEGSLAVLGGSFLAALGGLLLLGIGLPVAATQAVTIAAVVALVEALSPRGTDNFTVQLAAALVLYNF